jgi:hypothetical protein
MKFPAPGCGVAAVPRLRFLQVAPGMRVFAPNFGLEGPAAKESDGKNGENGSVHGSLRVCVKKRDCGISQKFPLRGLVRLGKDGRLSQIVWETCPIHL